MRVPLLNFEGAPGVPLLVFEEDPGSQGPEVPGPGSWSHFYTITFGVNFIKKRLQRRYCPVNISKFLRTPILKNIRERLYLKQLF